MPIGELAALGTAVCWAFTSLIFAAAARRIGSLSLNLLRLPVALVLLSALLLATRTPLTALDARSVALLALSGLIGLVLGDLAFFAALRRLGARLASLLMALAPVFAAGAGALLLAERPSPRAALGILLTLAGVAWVVAERPPAAVPRLPDAGPDPSPVPPAPTAGVALAVVGAACQGVGLVLAKMGMAAGAPPLAATWVRMLAATTLIWAGAAAGRRLEPERLALGLGRALPFALGGALAGPTLGVWLSLVAANATDVAVAATIMATSPVLILPLVMVAEHDRPSARAVLGTVAAVAGVALLFSR